MKAVYVPSPFDPKKDLVNLNKELKDSFTILKEIVNTEGGRILIIDEANEQDKK